MIENDYVIIEYKKKKKKERNERHFIRRRAKFRQFWQATRFRKSS